MKSWTLAAITGLVGMVSVSSLGCAGSDDEREGDTQASTAACTRPTDGDVQQAARWKTGNKLAQDDWLAPTNSDCALQNAESAPSDAPR